MRRGWARPCLRWGVIGGDVTIQTVEILDGGVAVIVPRTTKDTFISAQGNRALVFELSRVVHHKEDQTVKQQT